MQADGRWQLLGRRRVHPTSPALPAPALPQITDSCKECTDNNILVSERGFANLTGVDVNVSPMLQVGLLGWGSGARCMPCDGEDVASRVTHPFLGEAQSCSGRAQHSSA